MYAPRYAPYYSYSPYYFRYGYGGFGLGYLGYYDPYGWDYPAYGYGGSGSYYGGPGYYGRSAYYDYGGLRLKVKPRDGEVYADGYYVGCVDDFDGILQRLPLEWGPHKIEIRAEGFEPIAFDVRIEPGRTITYQGVLRPIR